MNRRSVGDLQISFISRELIFPVDNHIVQHVAVPYYTERTLYHQIGKWINRSEATIWNQRSHKDNEKENQTFIGDIDDQSGDIHHQKERTYTVMINPKVNNDELGCEK